MGEFVRIETGGDVPEGVAILRFERPPMNALSRAVQEEIREAAHELGRRSEVRAVVLYGGPKLFAAGADVKEMAAMGYSEMAVEVVGLQSSFDAVAAIPKPVVAAVTGYALGGGLELAMCADIRIAGDNARLGQPEILLGIIPGAGGTQRLPRLIGPAKAKELCFTGRQVRADEALAIGLVDKVVAPDDVLTESIEWAKQFANGPAVALRAVKDAINQGLNVDLASGLAVERHLFAGLFATEDRKIGMDTFVEKGPGKAEFVGR